MSIGRFIQSLLKPTLTKRTLFFLITDTVFVACAVLGAFALRFDGVIPAEKIENLIVFLVLSLFTAIPTFFLFGLYQIAWSYVTITDLPRVVRGVVAATAFSGLGLFLFRFHPFLDSFPRSVIIIYGLLLLLFVGGSRFAKRLYWQLVRGRAHASLGLSALPTIRRELKGHHRRILVTGGAGYIGSVLVRRLLQSGYSVRVVDRLLFGRDSVEQLLTHPNFELIQEDILNIARLRELLVDVDTVVHLAAVVGEAACTADKDRAIQINYLGTLHLARLCKSLSIKKFIFTSTCSVYGLSGTRSVVSEKDVPAPVDYYGETKTYAENELLRLADDVFSPTILRLSTVYGLSPRMRFDLVVNTFTKKALRDKTIVIFGGSQWRPLIHVSDVARAIELCIMSPKSEGRILNVGANEENYLISDLGTIIQTHIEDVEVQHLDTVSDKRSYRVSFDAIVDTLNFKTEKRIPDGVIEIKEAILSGAIKDLDDKRYYNHLILS